MKQHITICQWDELTPVQYNNISNLFGFVSNSLSMSQFLTIGKMIEILKNRVDFLTIYHATYAKKPFYGVKYRINHTLDSEMEIIFESEELCDALWKAVKEVL